MRARVRQSAVICAVLLTAACASTAKLSTKGKAAYAADEFVRTAGLVQTTAIAANTDKLLTDRDTYYVVSYVKSAVLVAKASPQGWQAIVAQGLTQLQADLSPPAKQRLGPYLATLQTILAAIGGVS